MQQKFLAFTCALLLATQGGASTIIRYESSGKVIDVIQNQDSAAWVGKPGILIDPDVSAVAGVPATQWRVENGTVRPATSAELSADAAALDIARKERLRQLALDRFDVPDSVMDRAIVSAFLDEINALRAAEVPALPAITKAQMRNRIRSKIIAGDGD